MGTHYHDISSNHILLSIKFIENHKIRKKIIK